jgi:hypothetical protein
MYPVTGIAGTVSRGGCDVCGLAAALSDDGSRLLARSRQFAPVAIHVRILPDKGALGFAGVVRGNSLGIFRDSIQIQVIQATGEKRRLWGE